LIDVDILNELYEIISMGILGISYTEGKIKNKDLAKSMKQALEKYEVNKEDITKLLSTYGENPKDVSGLTKVMNKMYTDISLINGSDEKIVSMLIEGTNKGIIKLEAILNRDIDSKIRVLAKEELDLLESQIKKWKQYL